MNCLAVKTCKSFSTHICASTCPLYTEIMYQLALSSIPRRHTKYLTSSLPETWFARDVFARIGATVLEKVSSGWGAYFHSTTTGTGKTDTACAIAVEYIIEQLKEDLREGRKITQLVKFIHVPSFLDDLKRGFDDEEAAQKAAELIDTLTHVPLVILDDLGAERPTEWARERLLTVINERYDNERSMLITSNASLKEIEVTLGARIRSRIEGACVPIEFVGKDWRCKV